MDLSLPHETIEISALLPKIQAALDGIDPNLASEYLMTAAIDFTRDSRIMRMTHCIDITPCVTSYRLNTSGYRISEIAKITLSRQNCLSDVNIANLTHTEGSTLYLDEQLCQDANTKVIVETVVVPKRSGDTIPEDLYEDWEPAIISGALASLYLMSGATWGNKGLADRHDKDFSLHIKRARFLRIVRNKPITMRLSPKGRSR